jgi:hypothetical protein
MFGLIVLRAIGMGCILTVLQHHAGLSNWEGMLLGFGTMMILGTLFDTNRCN